MMVMRSRLKGARVCRCRGDQSGQQQQRDKDATDGGLLLLFHSKSVVGYGGRRSVPTVRVRTFSIYLEANTEARRWLDRGRRLSDGLMAGSVLQVLSIGSRIGRCHQRSHLESQILRLSWKVRELV